MPDHIYNWTEAFFRNHSHCTRCGNEVSQLRTISASIFQGSSIGPASYVVTASDLRPVSPSNFISKYADDTYLIIRLIISIHARQRSITLIPRHSTTKCGRDLTTGLPSTLSGFTRVDSIKVLGVTYSRKFSVSQHVDRLLAACSQSLFAPRTLRQHGLLCS